MIEGDEIFLRGTVLSGEYRKAYDRNDARILRRPGDTWRGSGKETDQGGRRMSTQGKVWLVGAGPGDVGLFTIKGREILAKAEVVVYDSLVGDGVLAIVPASAEKINVGKRAGHHTMKQENINQVLLEKAQEGKRVVRLKGGDPFLFGRGGEDWNFCVNMISHMRSCRV